MVWAFDPVLHDNHALRLVSGLFSIGQGILQMLGNIHGISLKPSDMEEIKKGMMTMPAHADVVEGLQKLKSAGFRMVTLTNSPPQSRWTESSCAIPREAVQHRNRAYKPAPFAYHLVAE